MKRYNLEYKLSEDWKSINNIIIYGFGKTAKGNIDRFIDEFNVTVIIDNDPKYKEKYYDYRGIDIVNLDKCELNNVKIIILAAGKALSSIKETLENRGLQEYIDYVDMDHFIMEWYLRFQNKLCLGKVSTSVTTRCTFNCKNCNMLMPYYKNPTDYNIEMLKQDAELFFSYADFVTSFVVIGGEPFLYGELEHYIDWLGSNYRERIGNIQIITNGSIIPSDNLLKVLKKYNCEVRISDYTEQINYGKQYKRVKDKINEVDVKNVEFVQCEWIDFGFPHDNVNMGDTVEELRQHMLNCHGMCHWLHNGKYYFCSSAWSAEECGLYKLVENQDFIDLRKLSAEDNKREKLMEFHIGNMENGYMNFCKVCRGFESDVMVKAAIQMTR